MKKLWLKIKSFFTSNSKGDPQGISEITQAIIGVVDIVRAVDNARDDESAGGGKITGGEWLGIGKSILPLFKTYKNRELLKAQFLDFTTQEGAELSGQLAMKGIIGDKAKEVVQLAFSAIEKLIDVYNTDVKEIIRILQK